MGPEEKPSPEVEKVESKHSEIGNAQEDSVKDVEGPAKEAVNTDQRSLFEAVKPLEKVSGEAEKQEESMAKPTMEEEENPTEESRASPEEPDKNNGVSESTDQEKTLKEALEVVQQEANKSSKSKVLVKADVIPRQKPKSGRFWKAQRSQFRSIKKDRGPRLTFEQRVKRKEEIEQGKEVAEMMKQRKYQKQQELREKIEANKKRKEENEKKAEVYQVIKNPAKIKRMKKKQLKFLAKRDTLEVNAGRVES